MHKIICSIIILTLALTGCGSKKINEDSQSGTIFPFEAVTPVKEGQKNIYVVLKVLNSQYWQDIVKGVTESGLENSCNVYVGASEGEGDYMAQTELLNTALDEGADAIILAPASSSSLSDNLVDIRNMGIPVILVDTIMNDTNTFDTCYMTDNHTAGQLAAEEMIHLLKETGVAEDQKAQIAIQITSVSSQTIIDRLAGFNQYWAKNASKNWTVLDEIKLNNGDKDKAKENCRQFLKDYPDLKGVFGCNNSSTIGFVTGLKESGETGVVLVGFDYADETAEFIKNKDTNAATIIQNQYDMGYESIVRALEILSGSKNEYKFIDTGVRAINEENQEEYEESLS